MPLSCRTGYFAIVTPAPVGILPLRAQGSRCVHIHTMTTYTQPLRPHYRTVVLSDIHLGTKHAKVNEVTDFLSKVDCDRLILNGDIIDGWHLQKSGIKKWKPEHTRFFKVLMKLMEKHDTEVIYVRGNHDDFLDALAPLQLGCLRIVREYEFDGLDGRRYLVVHGDIFDRVCSHMKWLALLGDAGYTALLWLNGLYNRWRRYRHKPYHSISQAIKLKVKNAVSYISDFEQVLAEVAQGRQCQGVICGHIHHPDDRMIGAVRYLNSGDWVETLSALTEDRRGVWTIRRYYASDTTVTAGVNLQNAVS